MIDIGERIGGIEMIGIIKEIFSWMFNNHHLATKDVSVFEKVVKADYQATNEVHHHNVNLIKLG